MNPDCLHCDDRPPPHGLEWREMPIPPRFDAVLDGWVGTPYAPGQRVRACGVDCVQLIGAVMDDLYRSPTPSIIPRLPATSAIHSTAKAFATIRALRSCFPTDVIRENALEPGDVIVVRAAGGPGSPRRPGHVLICGRRPYTALHAVQSVGVTWTSLSALKEILTAYRPRNKHLWA